MLMKTNLQRLISHLDFNDLVFFMFKKFFFFPFTSDDITVCVCVSL